MNTFPTGEKGIVVKKKVGVATFGLQKILLTPEKMKMTSEFI